MLSFKVKSHAAAHTQAMPDRTRLADEIDVPRYRDDVSFGDHLAGFTARSVRQRLTVPGSRAWHLAGLGM